MEVTIFRSADRVDLVGSEDGIKSIWRSYEKRSYAEGEYQPLKVLVIETPNKDDETKSVKSFAVARNKTDHWEIIDTFLSDDGMTADFGEYEDFLSDTVDLVQTDRLNFWVSPNLDDSDWDGHPVEGLAENGFAVQGSER